MKTVKMLTILVPALGLMAWQVEVSEAAPMGTAFTYQGRFLDANQPAEGEYDLQFKLFDAPNGGVQQGSTIDINDVDVIDGYFTVELDFSSDVFDGNDRWLQIGVREGATNDPFTILSPRQEVTPTPYALYAASGPGVPIPLDLSGSVAYPGAVIKGTNTGTGYGVYGKHDSSGNFGYLGYSDGGVYGEKRVYMCLTDANSKRQRAARRTVVLSKRQNILITYGRMILWATRPKTAGCLSC